jgi:hypothetical protein
VVDCCSSRVFRLVEYGFSPRVGQVVVVVVMAEIDVGVATDASFPSADADWRAVLDGGR